MGHPLTASEAFEVATSTGPIDGLNLTKLSRDDEESSIEYLPIYLNYSAILLCDDERMSILQGLEQNINGVITKRDQGTVLAKLDTEVEINTSALLSIMPPDDANPSCEELCKVPIKTPNTDRPTPTAGSFPFLSLFRSSLTTVTTTVAPPGVHIMY